MSDETRFGVDLSAVQGEDDELKDQLIQSTLSRMFAEVSFPDNGESKEITIKAEREADVIEFTIQQ